MNGAKHPIGCPSAVWSNDVPAKIYCDGKGNSADLTKIRQLGLAVLTRAHAKTRFSRPSFDC